MHDELQIFYVQLLQVRIKSSIFLILCFIIFQVFIIEGYPWNAEKVNKEFSSISFQEMAVGAMIGWHPQLTFVIPSSVNIFFLYRITQSSERFFHGRIDEFPKK